MMSGRQACTLMVVSILVAGCSDSPVGTAPPDPRGDYLLVAADDRPVPTRLPAWMGSDFSACAPGEASEQRLDGGVLSIRDPGSFTLTFGVSELCTSPGGGVTVRSFGVVTPPGQYTMRNSGLEFFAVRGPSLQFELLYTATYHPRTLRLQGSNGVLEFERVDG